jgi:cell division protein FtsQ
MPRLSKPRQAKAKAAQRPSSAQQPVWKRQLADWGAAQVKRWRRPLIGVAMALPVIGALAGGGYWAVSSGWLARTQNTVSHDVLKWTAKLGFAVADVRVVGRDEVPKDTILAILNLRPGDPILGFDPDAAREQLERLSWVGSVTVRRELPDLIQIRLVERQPAALWQNKGEISLIDAEGHVLETADVRSYRNLPLVAGEGAPARTQELFALLTAAPIVAERMIAASLIGERRWDVTLNNEVVLRLPETDPAGALARLQRVHDNSKLLDEQIISVDLRQQDRLVVETASPEVAEAIDPQKGI